MKTAVRKSGVWASVGAGCVMVLSLMGCGGGDEDHPPPTTPDNFLLTGSTARAEGGVQSRTLWGVDPRRPDAVAFSMAIDATPYKTASLYHPDLAPNQYRYLGESKAYFVRDRQLFQVSLLKTQGQPRAQQLSSSRAVCDIGRMWPIEPASKDDVWIEVHEAGPDGDCQTSEDNSPAYVVTGMAPDRDAVRLPARYALLDDTLKTKPHMGQVTNFFAVDKSSASPQPVLAFDANMVALGPLQGDQDEPVLLAKDVQFFNTESGRHYYSTQGKIYPLWASPNAIRLDHESVYELKSPRSSIKAIPDWGMTFLDGMTLVEMWPDQEPRILGRLDESRGTEAELLGKTGNVFVFKQVAAKAQSSTGMQSFAFIWMRGRDEPAIPLTEPVEAELSVLATSGEGLVYTVRTATSLDVRLVDPEFFPSDDRLVAAGVGGAKVAFRPSGIRDDGPSPSAVLWCEAAAGANSSDCSNGVLKAMDVGGRTNETVTLGRFSHSKTYSHWNALSDSRPAFLQYDISNFSSFSQYVLLATSLGTIPGNGGGFDEEMFMFDVNDPAAFRLIQPGQ